MVSSAAWCIFPQMEITFRKSGFGKWTKIDSVLEKVTESLACADIYLSVFCSVLCARYPPNGQNRVILAMLGVQKMALRMLKTNFWDHFSIQTSPQNSPKRHLMNPNRTSKSHFWPFCVFFFIFLPHFLWAFFEHGPYFSNGQNSHFPESKC